MLVLLQCTVNLIYAVRVLNMSFVELFAVLVMSHPRNSIQPHWEVRLHQHATQCWEESIGIELGLNRNNTRSTVLYQVLYR